MFLDEFGHSSIPDFDTLTTIRKYDVSISMILQSISQLESRYGKTAGEVEKMLGKQIITENFKGSERTRLENLLNADKTKAFYE